MTQSNSYGERERERRERGRKRTGREGVRKGEREIETGGNLG